MVSRQVATQTRDQIAMAAQGQPGAPTLLDLIQQSRGAIERALPNNMDPERFARLAVTLVKNTPKLGECEPITFLASLMVSAQLGLDPGPPLGLSWIIPRYNSKAGRMEAGFQLGYQGVIELFSRSGQFGSIQAKEVCENDSFEFVYGTRAHLHHKTDPRRPRGQSYAYWALAEFANGREVFVVLSRDDVEKRRARGQDGPAWKTDFDQMACKSAIMALKPWLPMTAELAQALATDDRTFTKIEPNMAAESTPVLEVDEVTGEIGPGEPADPSQGIEGGEPFEPPAAS